MSITDEQCKLMDVIRSLYCINCNYYLPDYCEQMKQGKCLDIPETVGGMPHCGKRSMNVSMSNFETYWEEHISEYRFGLDRISGKALEGSELKTAEEIMHRMCGDMWRELADYYDNILVMQNAEMKKVRENLTEANNTVSDLKQKLYEFENKDKEQTK